MASLTVQNAEIRTATVEIKTLTVSGKQVTLAVFRQLLDVPILGEDGVLAGEPWGTVNYHPDKCADDRAHWHIVWQRGSDLLRSKVFTRPPSETFWPEEADRFIASCVYDFAAHGNTRFFGGAPPINLLAEHRSERDDPGIVERCDAGFLVRMALFDRGLKAARALDYLARMREQLERRADDWGRNQLKHAEDDLARTVAELGKEVAGYEADTEALFAEYKAAVATEAERRARHIRAREVIAALPQLFIAV